MNQTIEPPRPRPLTRAGLGAVFVLYLLLAAIVTWPTAIHMNQYIMAEYMEAHTAFYNFWWFHAAILDYHVCPWDNPANNYPYGFSMAWFPIWIPYDALALPFMAAWDAPGMPFTFNLINLIAIALSGLAAFVLVRRLTADAGAAFVAGIMIAANPFRLWNLTRWHVSCLELLILVLYCFLRLIEDGSKKTAAAFIAAVTVLVYTSPSYTLDLALGLGVLFVLIVIRDGKSTASRQNLVRLAATAAVITVLALPLLTRLGSEMTTTPEATAQPEKLRIAFSANLASFLTPGENLKPMGLLAPLLPYSDPLLKREHGTGGYEIFMGYTVAALALFGLIRRRREAWPFAAMAALFIVLSLGPNLHLGSRTFEVFTPYRLFESVLPWLRFERTPVRHYGAALPFIALLFGYGLSEAGKIAGRRRPLLYLAAGALVLLEFNQAPLKLDHLPVPAFVDEIKNDPAPGSVLDLPQYPEIKRFGGFYQMFHHRPLIFALASRGDDPQIVQSIWHRHLNRPRAFLDSTPEEQDAALAELHADFAARQIRYVIVYPKFLEPEDLAALRQILARLGPEQTIRDDDSFLVLRFRSTPR